MGAAGSINKVNNVTNITKLKMITYPIEHPNIRKIVTRAIFFFFENLKK